MLISHSKKFIFFHLYKTAGTSLASALYPYSSHKVLSSNIVEIPFYLLGIYPRVFSGDFEKHLSPKLFHERTNGKFQHYWKFCYVRNPYDWQISLYNYILRDHTNHHHKIVKGFKSFDEYLDWRISEHFQLQKDFLYHEGECLVDYIGKFESIQEDYNFICKRLNLPSIDLKKLNVTKRPLDDYFDENSKDMFYEAYKPDFETFGYEK